MQTGNRVLQNHRLVPNASSSSLILKHNKTLTLVHVGLQHNVVQYLMKMETTISSDRNTAPVTIWLGR